MEPAVAGALYAAESVLSSAVAFAKGITHPTLPLKAALTHITSVALPRQHHTISVVSGRAYIFGGETAPGTLADNTMNIVILPSSGVLEADFTTIPARPEKAGDPVPGARKGHTAVVIGESIYIFGGEGVGDEKGRVWQYSTVSNSWSFLDPVEGSLGPGQRVGHVAASSEFPGPKDVVFKEKAPQMPADPAKVVPEPADQGSWGTVFVVGGRKVGGMAEGEMEVEIGELVNDALAFDLRSRTWSNIPSPPGQAREGAALALAGNRLYRFGGKGVEMVANGVMQALDVSPVWKHAEGGTTPLTSGWVWEEVGHGDKGDVPRARSGAGLVDVTTGQGRRYLLAVGGVGEGAMNEVYGDIWAFQCPSEKASAASIKDATRGVMKRDTHEGQWAEVKYSYVDAKGEEDKDVSGELKMGIGKRVGCAVAKGTEVDGASVVVWGGGDEEGNVLGDGWLVTVER